MTDIRRLLAGDEKTRAWVEYLEGLGEPDIEVALPLADDLPPVLIELAVPHEDIDVLIRMLPSRGRTPLWWLVQRCAAAVTSGMGVVGRPPSFPQLPASLGGLGRYFYVYAFLAVLPHVQAFHRSRGIPEDISRLTLADLGRQLALNRRWHGVGGLDDAFWLTLHFRGAIYQLGRLQFERTRLDNRAGTAIADAGAPYGPGDPALAVHVPGCYGPLTPAACDEALRVAKQFFVRHFPEENYPIAVCESWLLDDQLAEYLPAEANIIQFQRRFRLAHRSGPADEPILRFVFGTTTAPLAELTRRTTLERGVVDHLAAGRHWRGGSGWLPL